MGKRVFKVGDKVVIVGLMPGLRLEGEVIRSNPPRAKVTQRDKIWHGQEVNEINIRKVREGAR